jgi:Fe-Mn family superoxide dismutase
MSLVLPDLPFPQNALEPHISEQTVRRHYGAHHAGHVTMVNKLISGTELEFRPLEDLLQLASGKLLAHAAEAWNHAFYWSCLQPGDKDTSHLNGPFTAMIEQRFGSIARFRRQFTDAAVSLFGCGWVWLVKDINGQLEIVPNSSRGTPFLEAYAPILTCDVWEHAYYLDYGHSRQDYVEAFWSLVNWEFVAKQYQRDPRQLHA